MEDLTGRNLGPYEVRDKLGQGGMAVVYKGFQPSMEREVAIKVLPPALALDSSFGARFKQEAKVIASLEHARILPVYDYGEEDHITYLIMRVMEGGTLRARLQNDGPLTFEEAERVVRQAAEGLQYAHSKGVIHRDVTSNNIMFDLAGDACITDFGMAKILESAMQLTGQTMAGTPAYMSPEQGLGDPITPRTDVYALGIVLFEMLVGDVPFDGDSAMIVVVKHINDPMPDPRHFQPDMPDAVADVILKATEKEPEKRFADCMELADALTAAVMGKPVKKRSAVASERKPKRGPEPDATHDLVVPTADPERPVSAPQFPAADAVTQAQTPAPDDDLPRWIIPVAVITAILIVGAGIIAAIILTGMNAAGDEPVAQQPPPTNPPPPTQPVQTQLSPTHQPPSPTLAEAVTEQGTAAAVPAQVAMPQECDPDLNEIARFDFQADDTGFSLLEAFHVPPLTNAYLEDEWLVIAPGQEAGGFVQLLTEDHVFDPTIHLEVIWPEGPSAFEVLAFHVPDQESYFGLSIDTGGQLRLHEKSEVLAEQTLDMDIFDGEPHLIRFAVKQGRLQGNIDNSTIIDAGSTNRLPPGFVSFNAGDQRVHIDKLFICGLTDPPLPPD